jgi:hypothetical protein
MCRAPLKCDSSFALWLFCLGVAGTTLTLGGCGGGSSGSGGGGGGGATPTSITSISYTPNPVAPGGTAAFTASVNCSGTGTCPQSITWSAAAGQGSFAGSTYTSPAASGSYTVTATATGYSVSATETVSVVAALSVSLTCPPLVQIGVQGNVVPPTTYVCTASASDGKGVTLSANGPGISVNPSSGALTVTATENDSDAEGNFPSVVITATAKSDGSTHATATVLVTNWFLAQTGGTKGIQIMTSKGALVSTIPAVACGLPSFSPDHLSYACLNANYSGFGIYTLTVTSLNGTMSVGATETGNIGFASNFTDVVGPAYSPDGTQIVFMGEINAAQGVYTVAVNGKTTEKQLSNEPLANKAGILTSFPNFTADGTLILFEHVVSVNGTTEVQIWKMNASDGSNQTALSLPAGSISPFPTLDGKYLIFQGSDGIYRVDVGTGFALSFLQPIVTQVAGGQIPILAAISPDGSQVMYQTENPANPGTWYVWTANIDGSDQTQITPSAGQLMPTSWE